MLLTDSLTEDASDQQEALLITSNAFQPVVFPCLSFLYLAIVLRPPHQLAFEYDFMAGNSISNRDFPPLH